MQSPVNIVPGEGTEGKHQVFVYYQSSKEKIINLGHTIEVDYDSGSYVSYDGNEYQFKQLHFHTPSEHEISSDRFDMEMHIVHTFQGESQEEPQFLVIATLFKKGEEDLFISTFLDTVPENEGEVFESDKKIVDATEILPEELHDFYNYKGSLTTPPYTESVNWIVLKTIKEASSEQINKIKQFEGENARGAQILYDRVIENVN